MKIFSSSETAQKLGLFNINRIRIRCNSFKEYEKHIVDYYEKMCPKCSRHLLMIKDKEYVYECKKCDENFYFFEGI